MDQNKYKTRIQRSFSANSVDSVSKSIRKNSVNSSRDSSSERDKPKKRLVKVWTPEEDKLLNEAYQQCFGNWGLIAESIYSRNSSQCSQRWKRLNPNRVLKKKQYSAQTPQIVVTVRRLVSDPTGWQIRKKLEANRRKYIRERWINKLDTNLNFNPFSQIEDNTILLLFNQHGPKWSEISKSMPGRPENMVKNRFYSHIRKQLMNKGESTEDLLDITSQSSEDEINDQSQQEKIQENWLKNGVNQNMNYFKLDTIQSVREDLESLRPIDFLVGVYNRESSLKNQIEYDGQLQMPINSLESNREYNPFTQFKKKLFEKRSMSIEEECPFPIDPNNCFFSIPMPEFQNQNNDPQEINYTEQLFQTNQQQY